MRITGLDFHAAAEATISDTPRPVAANASRSHCESVFHERLRSGMSDRIAYPTVTGASSWAGRPQIVSVDGSAGTGRGRIARAGTMLV